MVEYDSFVAAYRFENSCHLPIASRARPSLRAPHRQRQSRPHTKRATPITSHGRLPVRLSAMSPLALSDLVAT